MTATSMVAKVRSGELRPSQLVEACLSRIEDQNPKLNCITDLQANRAREQAAAADEAQANGRLSGAMPGLPITIKSSIGVEGFKYECGSPLRRGVRAESDATLVANLRSEGAIVLGTTNVPEFLMAYETDNSLYGRTNSPFDLGCTPGGSSGGCSAAVASGCSAGSVGSDGGGSVRVPAHFCGLYGLKSTPGVLSRFGHWPGVAGPSTVLASVGPLCRSADDLSLFYEVAAGVHPDANDISAPFVRPATRLPVKEIRKTTIGWFDHAWRTPVTAETRTAVHDAVRALEDRGFATEQIDMGDFAQVPESWRVQFCVALRTLIESSVPNGYRLHPLAYEAMATKMEVEGFAYKDFLLAWAVQDMARAKFAALIQRYPYLICPVSAIPAYPHGQREWSIEGETVRYPDVFVYSQVFNLLGAPAASVPVGTSADDLPIGVQVVARPYDDGNLLTVVKELETGLGGPCQAGTRLA